MKKLLSILVMVLCALSISAQGYVTKFLGIPVDGTKTEMINKLKAKGFVYNAKDDLLSGEFNGKRSFVRVVTRDNKVWRIAVFDEHATNETDIKINFNSLVRQFLRKRNYTPEYSADYIIPSEEDISYEMSIHNKRYEASFHQLPNDAGNYELSLHKYLLEKFTEEQIADTTNASNALMVSARKLEFIHDLMNTSVWFVISETYGEYRIILYYDNEYNHKEGEDL